MRIGLNLLFLIPAQVGGTETYSVSLIDALAKVDQSNEYFVLVSQESKHLRLASASNFHRVVCPVAASSRSMRFMWEQCVLPWQAQLLRLDVLHSLGYISPLFLPCKSVVTIHDLNYAAIPEAFTPFTRAVQRFFVTHSARRADRIIAVSSFSRDQMVALLGVSQHKIDVVYEAPKPRRLPPDAEATWRDIKEQHGIRSPYVIAFNSLSPHKNMPQLLEAYARTGRQSEYQLVIVGHHAAKGPSLPDLAQRLGLADGAVVFTGYLSDEHISVLLSRADLFVFPSLYEGFGLPVLEAMAAGTAVVCSWRGSLPEIAGDAAVYLDPADVNDMSAVLSRTLAGDSRESMLERGQRNLKRFSWDKAAHETLAVYKRAMAAELEQAATRE